MAEKGKYILLTGVPGVGKTTLIKKICQELAQKNINVVGFYTEEIRDDTNQRIGFDVISLNGEKDKLARTIKHVKPLEMTQYKVGQYVVFPKIFEKIALPLFCQGDVDILVLDEIGKMELFSQSFKTEIEKVFKNPNISILATIPVPKNHPMPTVDALRTNPKCDVVIVDRSNRNDLLNFVCKKFVLH